MIAAAYVDSRLTGTAPNCTGERQTWDAWGHYHAMLGLLLWHDESSDRQALAAARRMGDLLCERFLGEVSPRLVDTGSTEMNLAPVHSLCLLYRHTKDERHLALARQIADELIKRGEARSEKPGQLVKDILARGEEVRTTFQKKVEAAVEKALAKAKVASVGDLDSLAARIEALEKKAGGTG